MNYCKVKGCAFDMSGTNLLLRSLAGPHLTGSAELLPSPIGQWEVYTHLPCRRIARQRVRWRADGTYTETLQIGLGQWIGLCRQGVPTALDIMFAPYEATELDLLAELRSGWRADDRAIEGFRGHVPHPTTADRTRVSPPMRRLEHNLTQLRRWGRFEPSEWARIHRAQQLPIAA